jgi:hypothetical protein
MVGKGDGVSGVVLLHCFKIAAAEDTVGER